MWWQRKSRQRRTEKLFGSDDFRALFYRFQQILAGNNRVLEIISEMEDKLSGEYIFDINYLHKVTQQLSQEIYHTISNLNFITNNKYPELFDREEQCKADLEAIIEGRSSVQRAEWVIPYDELSWDDDEQVGGKNAQLAEVRNSIKLNTPDGFALTTSAYKFFMDYNNLWDKLAEKMKSLTQHPRYGMEQFDREVSELFSTAKIPPDLKKAIVKGVNDLYKRSPSKPKLAVRSSAYGEDEVGRSYAGQFLSVLNCDSHEVAQAYVNVLASRFRYAINIYGGKYPGECSLEDLPMAVGVQEMIPARAAGVIYTSDPSGGQIDRMTISATLGLGMNIVSGLENSDYFQVSRLDPALILQRRVGQKIRSDKVVQDDEADTELPAEELDGQPCLRDEQVRNLAEMAIILDRYFKRPLDIEWCLHPDGKFYILQCRPLKLPKKRVIGAKDLPEVLNRRAVLMRGRGQIAQRGIAAGRVWQIKEGDDPALFPAGAIAVTKFSSPRLTPIIRRTSAIITDVGSSTGHMATVAREFGVPTIVGTGEATAKLTNGLEITVDAEENIIYQGIIDELLEYERDSEDIFRDFREHKILRKILRKITPLNLIDPDSSSFVAKNCQSYHDILRFSHEKAMQELAGFSLNTKRFYGIKTKRLKLSIPLGLSVVDIEGGLKSDFEGEDITSLEIIQSEPMKAILKGLTAPDVWSTNPIQLGLSDFISSLTRYSVADHAPQYQGQNLAVIAKNYMNLSLRLGYHFNVIDTYISDNINDNYIYFRFVGGVTESDRRQRRALALKKILENLDFIVVVRGDLVVARLTKWERDELLRILEVLGKLVGFTRQLDTQMSSDEAVDLYTKAFFEKFVLAS